MLGACQPKRNETWPLPALGAVCIKAVPLTASPSPEIARNVPTPSEKMKAPPAFSDAHLIVRVNVTMSPGLNVGLSAVNVSVELAALPWHPSQLSVAMPRERASARDGRPIAAAATTAIRNRSRLAPGQRRSGDIAR